MVHSRAVITTLLTVGTASVLAAPVRESFANVLAARGPEDPSGAFGQQPSQAQGPHPPPGSFGGQESQGWFPDLQLASFAPVTFPCFSSSSDPLAGGPPGTPGQGPQEPAGPPGFHSPPHLGGQFGISHDGPEGMRLPGAGMRGPGPHPPPGGMFPPGPPPGPPGGQQGPPHFGRRQMSGQQGPPQGPPPMGQHTQGPPGGPQGMQQDAPPPDMAGPGGPQPAHQTFGRRQSPQGSPSQDQMGGQQGQQGGDEGHGEQGPPGNGGMKPQGQRTPESQGEGNEHGLHKHHHHHGLGSEEHASGPAGGNSLSRCCCLMAVFLSAHIFEQVNNNTVLQTLKGLKDLKDIEVDHPADLMDMPVVLLTNIFTLKVRMVSKVRVRMDIKVKTVSKVTVTTDKVNRIKVIHTVAPLPPTMAGTSIDGESNQQSVLGVLGDVQYGSGT
ncbi:hypothetical protein F5876DRAFT_79710 [Lentinula aff. lateritia]|uniref:Uncharacterized protein n=1 Tax=Lentinula aff. lateritia TaxID=2804960 RepID=A0ACC1TS15_9AGAR|nr:hypothetical protein F5876DRAFT_79710 [Lentinula aff. lateritia]